MSWGKRAIAIILASIMILDSNTIILAEIIKDTVVEKYEAYQEEKAYQNELEKVEGQVMPEQPEDVQAPKETEEAESVSEVEKADAQKADAEKLDAEDLVEIPLVTPSETEEVPQKEVVLRMPETQPYQDEKETELQAMYGDPIEVTEYEKVYQVDATHYVTLITSRANTYTNIDGEEKDIDLTLVAKQGDTGQVFSPIDSAVDVALPAVVTQEEGIRIANGEHTLELFPQEGSYENVTVQENALRYNEIESETDVQYTLDTTGLKEDIILREWKEKHQFGYSFQAEGYEAEVVENQILIRKKNHSGVLFVLSAPLMIDADGVESRKITLSLTEKNERFEILVDADKEWLSSNERVYPVKIDPTIIIPTESLIQVTTSTVRGTYEGAGYGYAGYITGDMTGVPGVRDIGRSRMYYAINYNFKDSIPSEARIDSATLDVYQYVLYPQTNATFACYRVKAPWNSSGLTWDSSVVLPLEPAGVNSTSAPKKGMHQFDIRESVNNWVQGIAPNHGLVVMATDETEYGGAFYTPYSTGTVGQDDFTWDKRPSITIKWSVPDPVDLNYDINNTTVDLRTLMQTEITGKLFFHGVFADGVATPGATVSYTLNDSSKNYSGSIATSFSYRYPDSSAFDSVFPTGTTKYKDKIGNWQTLYPFTNPTFNTLYYMEAKAAKDGVTGKQKKSETFVIYKVTQYDTLPKIANYYGVPLSQMMHDNRVQDMLLVQNNTLFIRNPKKNATVPYNPPALNDDVKAKTDAALMGRGLHCEFGFEPVNLNTGNFYLNRIDVSIPDYTGDFTIERNYNSKGANFNSVFGRGWKFAYEEQLSKAENGDLYYTRDDGSILAFEEDNEKYKAPEGYGLKLTKKKVKEKTFDFGKGNKKYPVYEYSITDMENTTKTFDCFGMLISIEDEKGNTTTLTYDKNQNLKQIKSAAGTVYGITVNDEGHITGIHLPSGSQLGYEYDTKGDLITYTDANGVKTRYEYDKQHRMTAWYDGNGAKIVTNKYDSEGRVTTQTDANGGVSKLSYKKGQTTTSDANGNSTVYEYDDSYRTRQVTNPDGTTCVMDYNASNELISETNELGHTTTYG